MSVDSSDRLLTDHADLRTVYRDPAAPALNKEIDHVDGPPGFVAVLDDRHLAFPDLTGNNRLDPLSNLVENPFVALLFLIPGLDGDEWQPERWPDLADLPAPSCILSDHTAMEDLTPDVVEAALQDSYANRLW